MAVTIRIRETYDLSTNTNRMGLLAIHTPSVKLIQKLYPGLLLSYKYMKPESCDIALAAASLLPADPLQVGTEAGDIAPQDLFNPILYRAVSTDSFNTIMNRTYGFNTINSLVGGSVSDSGLTGSAAFSSANSTDVYYSLLSESGWKKAMPQSGLVMRNVIPLVYEVLNTFGNAYMPANASSLNYEEVVNVAGVGATATNTIAQTFRGRAHPLPRIPTIASMDSSTATTSESSDWVIPVGTPNQIPKVPCVLVVMPPAKLHKLFFRMTVSWTITFSEVCSIIERGTYSTLNNAGIYTHSSNYVDTATAKMDDSAMTTKTDMVDTVDVDAEMIMQS